MTHSADSQSRPQDFATAHHHHPPTYRCSCAPPPAPPSSPTSLAEAHCATVQCSAHSSAAATAASYASYPRLYPCPATRCSLVSLSVGVSADSAVWAVRAYLYP